MNQPAVLAPASLGGLSSAELALLRAVFERVPGLEKVTLFGSRAKGTHRPASDIDLALFGAVDLAALAVAARLLDESPLPYHVDLIPHAEIENADLRDHIARVGLVIWERNDE